MSKSVADSATAALRELLARGRYQPGDRLPAERELSAGLGVSRPTLREAIRRLTEADLLESRRGSGTYVADVPLEHVFALRMQLEPFAAGLAARHRDAATPPRLAQLLEQLGTHIDEPEDFAALDLKFHRTIAAAAANPLLEGMLARLSELVQLSRAITSPERDARAATLGHLELLAGAVRERDEAGAVAAMQAHLSSLADVARRVRPHDRRIAASRPAARPSVSTLG